MEKSKTQQKNYFFELNCSLSELGVLKAKIQPVKTIEDIQEKLPKQVSVVQIKVVEDKNIFLQGVVSAEVGVEKLHERFNGFFNSFDEKCIFNSKWKLLEDIKFDVEL